MQSARRGSPFGAPPGGRGAQHRKCESSDQNTRSRTENVRRTTKTSVYLQGAELDGHHDLALGGHVDDALLDPTEHVRPHQLPELLRLLPALQPGLPRGRGGGGGGSGTQGRRRLEGFARFRTHRLFFARPASHCVPPGERERETMRDYRSAQSVNRHGDNPWRQPTARARTSSATRLSQGSLEDSKSENFRKLPKFHKRARKTLRAEG